MSANAEFDKSFQITKLTLKFGGLNLDNLQHPNLLAVIRNSWLYFFCTLWMQSIVFGESCWCWLEGVKSSQSFAVLTFMIPFIVFGYLGTIKTAFLLLNGAKTKQVIDELRCIFPGNKSYTNSATDEFEEENIVKESMKLSRKVVYVVFTTNLVLAVAALLKPLYYLVYKYLANGEMVLTLPVLMKYPFDPLVLNVWPFMYLYEVAACFIAISNLVGADTLFFVCCTHVYMQYRLLRLRFQLFIKGDETDDEVHTEIVELVRSHQKLIEIVDILESIFSKSNFCNYLASSFLICLTGFNATTLTDGWSVAVYLLFLTSNVSQIFLICLFGDMIMSSSAAVAEGISYSHWYTLSPRSRKNLLFVLIRTHKLCKLTAGRYADINLQTFTTILSRSWSYFALLNSMSPA